MVATIAQLERAGADNHQPGIGIIPAQHHRVRAGLGQITRTTQYARQRQRAGARTGQPHIGAQHHGIGNHKAATAILRNRREGNPGQQNTITGNILRKRGVIGQVDSFCDQADQIVGRGITAARRATKVEH